MNFIGLKEFRQNMQKYINRISKGHSFIVLKHSRPIFKIAPVEESLWEDVIDFTKFRKGGIDIDELLARL